MCSPIRIQDSDEDLHRLQQKSSTVQQKLATPKPAINNANHRLFDSTMAATSQNARSPPPLKPLMQQLNLPSLQNTQQNYSSNRVVKQS